MAALSPSRLSSDAPSGCAWNRIVNPFQAKAGIGIVRAGRRGLWAHRVKHTYRSRESFDCKTTFVSTRLAGFVVGGLVASGAYFSGQSALRFGPYEFATDYVCFVMVSSGRCTEIKSLPVMNKLHVISSQCADGSFVRQ